MTSEAALQCWGCDYLCNINWLQAADRVRCGTRGWRRTSLKQRKRKLVPLPKSARRTKPAKHGRSREQVEQEQEVKQRISQQKREQEEHWVRRQREREERKLEKEQKRERRLRAREEREQERLWRLQWHEEIKREREQRLARQRERMACLAEAAATPSSTLSTIFVPSQALGPLPKPI